LTQYCATLPQAKPTIVMGDFNARLRSQIHPRKATLSLLHKAVDSFEDFLMSTGTVTSQNPVPTHRFGTLDYICTSARFCSAIRNTRVLKNKLWSDHALMIGLFRAKYKQPTPPDHPPQYDFTDIRGDTGQQCRATLLTIPHDTSYADFVPLVHSALELLPQRKRVRRLPAWRTLLVQAAASTEAQSHGALEPNAAPFSLSAVSVANSAEVDRLLVGYASFLKSNPRYAWAHVSAIARQTSHPLPAADVAERNAKFHAHFTRLFQPPLLDTDSVPSILDFAAPHVHFVTGPPRDHEVQSALDCISNGKSPGIDGVPNEVLRCREIFPAVCHILRTMYTNGATEQQRTSIVVPIPKKGDASVLDNWRGISLMPHITKLYNLVLLHRLRSSIDRHLLHAQNGFRPGRGTLHHIMTLRALLDATATSTAKLHGCFIDFSKAFDSVRWHTIRSVLASWRVPAELVAAIFTVMEGHCVKVRSDGILSDPIEVRVGVLQGDTLAPFLFILVVDAVLRGIPDVGLCVSAPPPRLTTRQMRLYAVPPPVILSATAYADDICFLASSLDDLQSLFSALERRAATAGLRINYGKGKTERFVVNDLEGVLLSAGGVPIHVTTSYKYLGVQIFSFDHDLALRKAKAWAALRSMRDVWCSSAMPYTKRRLFSALIDPILTYGLSAWPLSATQCARLDSVHGRMLRYAMGLPHAFISRAWVHTESLYGHGMDYEVPFTSAQARGRKLAFLGHVVRGADERGESHPLLHALAWDPLRCGHAPRRGPRTTLLRGALSDAEVDTWGELSTVLRDRRACSNLRLHAQRRGKADAMGRVSRRRECAERRTARAPEDV
jgi:hypothetical protein